MSRLVTGALLLATLALIPDSVSPQDPDVLMSLDSLLNIRISAAARYEQTTREAAASTTVVTRDDIQRYGWRSVGEVVGNLSGFYTTSDHTFEYLGARGFGRPSDYNNRLLLLLDGQPANGLLSGQADLEEGPLIPLDHVERIEVVRGPGSALYGSSAMLAVINVVTRTAASGRKARVRVERDSNELSLGTASLVGTIGDAANFSAFASWRDDPGSDLYVPEFAVPGVSDGWLRQRDYGSAGAVGATIAGHGFRLDALVDQSDRGDPNAPYGTTVGGPSDRSSARRSLHMAYAKELSARSRLNVSVGYLDSETAATLSFEAPAADRLALLAGTRVRGEAQMTIDLTPAHRLTFGSEVSWTNPELDVGDDESGIYARFGREITVASGFVQHEWQVRGALSFVAGARVDDYSTVGAALSPRGAVVYHASDATTLKLLYGEAFRAPTPLEQFLEEPGALMANPLLGPEKIRTAEIVVEQRLGSGLLGSVFAYDYRMRDLIGQAFDPTEGVLTYQNLAQVEGRGIGLDVTGRLPNGTAFFVNGTVQHVSDALADQDIVNSPPYLLRAGASTTLPRGFRVGLTLSGDGARHTYRGADSAPLWLTNLTLTTPMMSGLELSVISRNLFDVAYGFPAGLEHRQVLIPQRGRSIRFALSAAF